MKIGNTKLIESGIRTERSHIRAHVCPRIRRVYVFKTSLGIQAIDSGSYPLKAVRTGEIVTAMGYLVPPHVLGCSVIDIPEDVFYEADFDWKDNTSEKGRKATFVIKRLIEQGLFPMRFTVQEINERMMQISGIDVTMQDNMKIQVKMDYNGGDKRLGGTGNLYLQTAECNPYRRY